MYGTWHAACHDTADASPVRARVSSSTVCAQCVAQDDTTQVAGLTATHAQAVFKMPPVEAVSLIRTGKSVLEGWHNTYMQVREKIEMSGRDARWEFSKPMLFERTNYMAEICSDLSEMVEIVDDFHKFLGPELKAVTGDNQVCRLFIVN